MIIVHSHIRKCTKILSKRKGIEKKTLIDVLKSFGK